MSSSRLLPALANVTPVIVMLLSIVLTHFNKHLTWILFSFPQRDPGTLWMPGVVWQVQHSVEQEEEARCLVWAAGNRRLNKKLLFQGSIEALSGMINDHS